MCIYILKCYFNYLDLRYLALWFSKVGQGLMHAFEAVKPYHIKQKERKRKPEPYIYIHSERSQIQC